MLSLFKNSRPGQVLCRSDRDSTRLPAAAQAEDCGAHVHASPWRDAPYPCSAYSLGVAACFRPLRCDGDPRSRAGHPLRARPRPTVSTPVTWDEVEEAANDEPLSFEAPDVLARVESMGDLFAETRTLEQTLPPT